jgi:hypothetical protein
VCLQHEKISWEPYWSLVFPLLLQGAILDPFPLDDLYKTVLVLITEHYIKDPATLLEKCMRLATSPAATASKAVFKAMQEKGWHEARLLGYTDVGA